METSGVLPRRLEARPVLIPPPIHHPPYYYCYYCYCCRHGLILSCVINNMSHTNKYSQIISKIEKGHRTTATTIVRLRGHPFFP